MLTIFCFLVKRMHVFKNCKMKGINCRSITIFQKPFIEHVNWEICLSVFWFSKNCYQHFIHFVFYHKSILGICQSGNNLDSLLVQLQNTNNPYERILSLNSIANKPSATNNDTAVHLCYEGLNLSQNQRFAYCSMLYMFD